MPVGIRDQATAIATLNLKGGVGKTHTVWLIAGVCQERGQRLLVVDLDTQGNLSRSLLPDANAQAGVQSLFDPTADANTLALIHHTRFSHVDVIPAGPALAPFDLTDQRSWEQTDLQFALADALREVREGYDLIVFD